MTHTPVPTAPSPQRICSGMARQAMSSRRGWLHGGLAVAAMIGLGASSRLHAQTSLPQPLDLSKILLGVPPGGLGDRLARSMADKLRGVYAANVIVENKPGVGGQLAVTAACCC